MKNRRTFLKTSFALAGLGSVGEFDINLLAQDREVRNPNEYRIALNTATIIHYGLPLFEQIRLAHEAGYQNIEIWFRDLDQALEEGKTLSEIRKRLDDFGMRVVGGINFFQWGVPEEDKRKKALDAMKRGMEQMKALGCSRFAAAPSGIFHRNDVSLSEIACRYREILELGEQFEVYPQLEIWGAGPTLSKLSDAVWVVTEAAHPEASLLLDVYHLFRGGNDFISLRQLNGKIMTNFHWNDWPGGIPRLELKDGDRVFPGDGAAPLDLVRGTLREIGFAGTFSLEIFNKGYCEKYSPNELLKLSYEKMKKAV